MELKEINKGGPKCKNCGTYLIPCPYTAPEPRKFLCRLCHAEYEEVNDDKEVMTISGLVNPTDVNRENTINSYQIANVKISYKGKGAQSDGSRPGLFMRIINFIF